MPVECGFELRGCGQIVGCTATGMSAAGLGQARPWVGPPSSRAPPGLGSGPLACGHMAAFNLWMFLPHTGSRHPGQARSGCDLERSVGGSSRKPGLSAWHCPLGREAPSELSLASLPD